MATRKKSETTRAKSQRARKRMTNESQREAPAPDIPRAQVDPGQMSNSLWRQAPWKAKYNPRSVEGPDELWGLAAEYFEWVEQNPLYEAKVFSTQAGLQSTALPKMRAMTIEGLCTFLGISRDTWNKWGHPDKHPDLADAVMHVNAIIREQKFTGAAAELLNPNLISRDLGLSEKQEVSGPNGGPVEFSALTKLTERLDRLAAAQDDT